MTNTYDVTVGSGKYRIVYDDKMRVKTFRHGEPWDRDVTGDGMILALVQKIAAADHLIADLFAHEGAEGFSDSTRELYEEYSAS